MQGPQATPRARAILLGASNLTAALPLVVDLARAALGTPLDIYAALGRGRSYGVRSSFLVRSMPGIAECGLWTALAREPAGRCAALLCDPGNDLAFGFAPGVIAGWVDAALARLEPLGARTVIATLPLRNLQRLSPLQFELSRRLLFPRQRLERARLLADAERLDGLLRGLARARGASFVELEPDWYGADPIHIARARRQQAWTTLLAPWFDALAPARARNGNGSFRAAGGLGWRSELLAPAERSILGMRLRHAQPCARLADGTALHLY